MRRSLSCQRACRIAVGCSDLPWWAIHDKLSLIQPEHTITLHYQEIQAVRYEHRRDPGLHQPLHTDNALAHKELIPHTEYLVDQEHLWLDICGQSKGEPGIHA